MQKIFCIVCSFSGPEEVILLLSSVCVGMELEKAVRFYGLMGCYEL